MWEHTTRYLGTYASRTRGAAKAQHPFTEIANAATAAVVGEAAYGIEPKRATSRYWATCITLLRAQGEERVYEVDPLSCPKCGEQMKIAAFITDSKRLTKLCNHLGDAA